MKKLNTRLDEAMSVTLRPSKSQPGSFKVHSVGSKMKAHGGIKPGERVKDSHIDDFHDSGIKVKYHKEGFMDTVKKGVDKVKKVKKDIQNFHKTDAAAAIRKDGAFIKKKASIFDEVQNEAIERRADRKTIIATDPTTGRKVLKVAPKKEIEIGKGKQESVEIGEGKYSPYISIPKSDPKKLAQTKKEIETRTGHARNFVKPKPGGGSFTDANGVKTMSKGKVNVGEDNLNELSPDLIKKVAHKRAINTSMAGSKADYDRRDPDYQKAAAKQQKNQTLRFNRGAKAAGNIRKSLENGMKKEETVAELKINTMKVYQSAAAADQNDQENARHKNYPEKQIDARQAKREKGIRTADKRIAKKQVKMAKGVAFDKRYKGGNMTGASKAIDKIKPGLSDHPKVKAALRRANEEFKLGE